MDLEVDDIENLHLELTCTKCEKLLSVFPIYTSSAGYICGRCTESVESMISNNSIKRSTDYEILAKHVSFPCTNREFGCEVILKHNEVVSHEECCSHRPQMCPFNVLQCDWKDVIKNLDAHLDLNHTSAEINNSHTFILNIDEIGVKVNFLRVELQTFFILSRYDSETQKFYCLVMCCDEEVCRNLAYQMELSKGDFRFTYPNRNIQVLIETFDAFEKADNIVVIDISTTIAMSGNLDSNLNWKICITKLSKQIAQSTSVSKDEVPNSTDTERKLLESNQEILIELECPVCNNYMKPPIYICATGHSLCNECKIKVVQCPTCRVQQVNIRNFTLESLTEKVLYPCKYSLEGCTEILYLDEIVKHQFNCSLRTDCPLVMSPLSCNVKLGILNPLRHICEKHSQSLLIKNEVCKIYVLKAVNRNIYNVTITYNEVFIFCYTYSCTPQTFKFNFCHLGQKTSLPIYRYTLEFVDKNKLKRHLIVKNVCRPLFPTIDDAFNENCSTIPWNLLASHIYENKDKQKILSFKFKIEKI